MKNQNEKQMRDSLLGKESMKKKSNRKKEKIEKIKKPQLIELSPELEKEVCSILDNRISSMRGEKLNPRYKDGLYKSVVALYDFVSKHEPFCSITSLKDFTKEQALAFQDHLVQTGVSPFSEKKIHKNSLFAIEIRLKNVFQQGKGRGVIEENIFNTIDIPSINKSKSLDHGYVSEA